MLLCSAWVIVSRWAPLVLDFRKIAYPGKELRSRGKYPGAGGLRKSWNIGLRLCDSPVADESDDMARLIERVCGGRSAE
jgi:hypothetical protein